MLRESLAAKLLAAGIALSLLLIGSVSAYLLVSRHQQTNAAALSNADNRAAVLNQLIINFTGAQSMGSAQALAQQPGLIAALNSPAPAQSLSKLLAVSPVALNGNVMLVTDGNGTVVYQRASSDIGNYTVLSLPVTTMLVSASQSSQCVIPRAASNVACGLEVINGQPSFDVAVPVVSGGRLIGAVTFIAPIGAQFSRYQSLLTYPLAVIDAQHEQQLIRISGSGTTVAATPGLLTTPIQDSLKGSSPGSVIHAVYSTQSGEVAGSFTPLAGPRGELAGWIGVEAPYSIFAGDTFTDEMTVGLIAVLAILITVIGVTIFVSRVVWRPVARLERGVARIARGDYESPIEVVSADELGRLAESVNTMRAKIKDYVSQIEEAQARLNASVVTMGHVSRALTVTGTGVDELQRSVVQAASGIAGVGSRAWMSLREDGTLKQVASYPQGLDIRLSDGDAAKLMAGEPITEHLNGGVRLMVPMNYQSEVVGIIGVQTREDTATQSVMEVLSVLANNAAVARENARLFQTERETVQRLRELDAMKTNFMATVQHELRTPLTAIMGMADMLDLCWEKWPDKSKLDGIEDIQIAGKRLFDIVETIIDFTTFEGQVLTLNPVMMKVAPAIDRALTTVTERYKGGVGVKVDANVDPLVQVYADPERFDFMMRALLDNAIKFSDGNGEVMIRAHRRSPDAVRIEIEDRGIGIPPEELNKVFDRFFQVDNTATRKFGGTGMGLALVKRTADAHGARVLISSILGKGTSVRLDWPARASAAGAEARIIGTPGAGVSPPQEADSKPEISAPAARVQ